MGVSIRRLLILVGVSVFLGVFLQFSSVHVDENEAVLPSKTTVPPFLVKDTGWVDSVMATLSLQEKVGQMLMVAAYPKNGEEDKQRVTKLIKEQNIGGIIFFQGTPKKVAELAAYYQSISKIPLLMAIDGEWGLAMRLKNSIKYPKQMMLGAISNDMLIHEMGKDIARQLKQIGIHANFAPVVDVNNNPDNPVINSRSFGEGRANVARKGILYMKGMQDEGVLAFAKHFPGHGDTKTDSHYGLPVIAHPISRLDSLELYPFRALINAGVAGVMIAHMNVLSLDSTKNRASTLSPLIIDSLLNKKLAFKGLVITDAMNMRGVSNYYTPIEANKLAIIAGNDILLMPAEEKKSINLIVSAIKDGEISEDRLNLSCLKILKAKKWILDRHPQVQFEPKNIHKGKFYHNRKKLIEASLTVLKNENKIIPLHRLDTLKIAHIHLGPQNGREFIKTLKLYTKVDSYTMTTFDSAGFADLKQKLENYNLIIASLHSSSISTKSNFKISDGHVWGIEKIIEEFPTILTAFVNPYALNKVSKLNQCLAFVESYENDTLTQSLTAQMLFGAIAASGRLPVGINNQFKSGDGINTYSLQRLSYVSPYEAGIDKTVLTVVDSIVQDAIVQKAMPGCQVLAAKNGKVFLNQAYGYHTYKKTKPVNIHNSYDLASLTKVSATLPALIKLQKEKIIDIEEKLGKYWPEIDTCDKKEIKLSDILLHQSGLKAWIPFYWSTIEPIHPDQQLTSTRYSDTYSVKVGRRFYANKHLTYKEGYFQDSLSETYTSKVANNLYINNNVRDSIWFKIAASPLKPKGKYKYSDLGFYIFYKIIQDQTQKKFDNYLDSVFYKPLGASSLCFNPLKHSELKNIIPTENDLVFRKQIVHGYVHDPGAAMLGGVCGHAGLFGNANDMAKLIQMYLNGGRYGGKQYLSKKLINKYTSCIECSNGNRRGLGFDKPNPDTTKPGPSFKGISTKSYGHTGFTGTMVWADPSTGILYVFLSNRVFPDALNSKLVSMDVRTKIQKSIYEAILEEEMQ